MEADVPRFYENVKEFSQKSGYDKIADLLIELGIRRSTYYERKRKDNLPPAEDILKFAEKMNVSCDFLITGYDRNPLINKYGNLLSDLDDLDSRALRFVEITVLGLAEDCRKKNIASKQA